MFSIKNRREREREREREKEREKDFEDIKGSARGYKLFRYFYIIMNAREYTNITHKSVAYVLYFKF